MQKTNNGIKLQIDNEVINIEVWSPRIIRVSRQIKDIIAETKSLAVISKPEKCEWKLEETASECVLTTAYITVRVKKENGEVSYHNQDTVYLSENRNEQLIKETWQPAAADGYYSVNMAYWLHNASLFGLGQHQTGLFNYQSSIIHLQQANTDIAVPMMISNKGWGLYWDCPSITDVAVHIPNAGYQLKISSEAVKSIDYYFIAGPALDDVIASYRHLTGEAPMMPRWTWGLWQSRERYQTQEEILGVAEKYRELRIPIDGIVQDWQYWKDGQWGSHEFDPERFSDPAEMVDQLHKNNYHVMISVWPRFDVETTHLKELEEAGAIYPEVYRNVYPPGFGKWYDAYNSKGRKLYWKQISEKLGVLNFDAWWLDASEAELGGWFGQMRTVETAEGIGASVNNAYPLMHTTAVYEGHRKDIANKRAFILTRSAYAGLQRNASVAWSGDIHGNWEVFRNQIPAGLNFCASGIPYWNTDIGGFFGGNPEDPYYRELFVRWFQYGAFCPMFRIHGTCEPKEIWRFDSEAQRILIEFDELRYRLLPYIYSVSWMVTNQGYTMMRPLVMDFPNDGLVLNIKDQFMFGPALLVNPVVDPGAEARNVYLPAGHIWYDFWTGKKYENAKTITANATLDTMPLYVKAGTILPMGPVVQYAAEKLDAPIELRIYEGADGYFEIYEDEGDNYNYENGVYSIIPLQWNNNDRSLSIGARQGEYPGMVLKRKFNIVVVKEGHGIGLDETSRDTTVDYEGQKVTVRL